VGRIVVTLAVVVVGEGVSVVDMVTVAVVVAV